MANLAIAETPQACRINLPKKIRLFSGTKGVVRAKTLQGH